MSAHRTRTVDRNARAPRAGAAAGMGTTGAIARTTGFTAGTTLVITTTTTTTTGTGTGCGAGCDDETI